MISLGIPVDVFAYHVFLWAFFFCYVYFIWDSPIMEWLKKEIVGKTLNKIKVSRKDGVLRWCALKFEYLINCPFCITGWSLIFSWVVSGFEFYFFFLMVTVPWVVIVMWVFFLACKKIAFSKKSS